jgi:SAM-dependent methyltransferase
LPFAEETFDIVTSFDVLYHVDVSDDVAALKEMARVMVPGGLLLFRLPAIKWLSGSPHDRAVHTRHRYTRGEVIRKIYEAGIDPVRITYANTILFLPAMLWRLSGIATASGKSSDLRVSGSVINRACTALLRLEAMVLNFADFPIGLSVCAIAKKGTI